MKEKTSKIIVFSLGLFMVLAFVFVIAGPFLWMYYLTPPYEAPLCPGYGEPHLVEGTNLLNQHDNRESIMNKLERAGWKNVTLHESNEHITAYCPSEIGEDKNG